MDCWPARNGWRDEAASLTLFRDSSHTHVWACDETPCTGLFSIITVAASQCRSEKYEKISVLFYKIASNMETEHIDAEVQLLKEKVAELGSVQVTILSAP